MMEIWRCGISLICFTSRIIVTRYLNQLYKLYQLWGKILYRKYDDQDESCLINWQTSNVKEMLKWKIEWNWLILNSTIFKVQILFFFL